MPESSTDGLGAGKKGRSWRRGVEKIHGRGVVYRAAVMADQGACTEKIMRETGIRCDVTVGRFRFIWELKHTHRRTIDGKYGWVVPILPEKCTRPSVEGLTSISL